MKEERAVLQEIALLQVIRSMCQAINHARIPAAATLSSSRYVCAGEDSELQL